MVDAGASIILGHPLMSKFVARYFDGGSSLYSGYGYHIFYANKLSGERGPVVWTWFVPVEFSLTSRRIGVYPLGTEESP
jgi:hypothetical protein